MQLSQNRKKLLAKVFSHTQIILTLVRMRKTILLIPEVWCNSWTQFYNHSCNVPLYVTITEIKEINCSFYTQMHRVNRCLFFVYNMPISMFRSFFVYSQFRWCVKSVFHSGLHLVVYIMCTLLQIFIKQILMDWNR